MKKLFFPILLFAVLSLLATACENYKLPETTIPDACEVLNATYRNQIKSIVDNSCAYSGCHDGAGGIGTGDFTTYDGIAEHPDHLRERVITFKDDPSLGMPPNHSIYPQSKKDNLTDEELELMQCWIESGLPE